MRHSAWKRKIIGSHRAQRMAAGTKQNRKPARRARSEPRAHQQAIVSATSAPQRLVAQRISSGAIAHSAWQPVQSREIGVRGEQSRISTRSYRQMMGSWSHDHIATAPGSSRESHRCQPDRDDTAGMMSQAAHSSRDFIGSIHSERWEPIRGGSRSLFTATTVAGFGCKGGDK